MRDIFLVALAVVVCAVCAPSRGDIVPAGVEDNTTLGNWLGVYGSEGYILCSFDGVGSDRVSLPTYLSGYGLTNVSMWVWYDPSTHPEGLRDPADPDHRVESCWYAGGSWSVTLTPTETRQFNVALYMLDPENSRTQTITFSGAGLTGTDTIAQIYPGTWMVYGVTATAGQDVTITFDQVGGPNAVLSALAFDPIPEPASLALLGVGAALLGARRRRGA